MKRLFAIFFMVSLLLLGGILEIIYIEKSSSKLYDITNKIHISCEANESNLNNKTNITLVDELKTFWDDAEKKLCLVVNYESIKCISETIAKLQIAIEENDKSVAYENIILLKNYSDIIKNVMGFNFHNLL